MSTSAPSTSTAAPPTTTTTTESAKPKEPELLPLEEDDEFEEFTEDDWADDKNLSEKTKTIDSLWEDNWDDDDVEDDFSTQLRAKMLTSNFLINRAELAKQDQMQT